MALTLSKETIPPLTPFAITGVQFNQEFNRRDHRNKDDWLQTSAATHPEPPLAGQLLSTNSSGGSSQTSLTVSIGIPPTIPPELVLSSSTC
ncbi:hypothetical protein DEO72_LG1g2219 [Vigna unguiculata]|uniref:Uncharacterized protein n=1 Tax=Vigna unguiculata TaxID=3917 RepID=A0A4D6KPZ8_VIGUN|nr:hypothetical protein DEO72_LG1g2219 [Vigna unguiculata]